MSIQTSEQSELERLRAEVAALRGLLPELPPRPPDTFGHGALLSRYGLRWNGPGLPVSVPMDDGYWTPWHIAQSEAAALRLALDDHVACKIEDAEKIEQLREALDDQRAEVAALRKDAVRYKTLRQQFSPMGLNIDGNHTWRYVGMPPLRGPNLDAAIDAAMSEQAMQALVDQAQELDMGYGERK